MPKGNKQAYSNFSGTGDGKKKKKSGGPRIRMSKSDQKRKAKALKVAKQNVARMSKRTQSRPSVSENKFTAERNKKTTKPEFKSNY